VGADIRADRATVGYREEQADKMGLEKNSLSRQEYVLTGKFPSAAALSHKYQKGPLMENADGLPEETYFDPASGEILSERTHQPVPPDWKRLSPSDLATKTINLMTPDGPQMVFRRGDYLYDNDHNKIDGKLVPLLRGMLPTENDREVVVYDPDTHQYKKMLFRSTHKVTGINFGESEPPPQVPGGAQNPQPAGKSGGASGSGKGGPPPVPGSNMGKSKGSGGS